MPFRPLKYPRFPVQVNTDSFGRNIRGDAANEPSLAIDPLNRMRMAIGWRQFATVNSNFREAGVAYSTNGGLTWTAGVLDPGVFRSDPVLESDAQGDFYFLSYSAPDCEVFASSDGGATWSAPVPAFGGDKPWMVIDRTGGPGQGNLYQAWSIFSGCCGANTFNRSVDGAATFSTPQAAPLSPFIATLAVAPNGALYIGGSDIFGVDFAVVRSSDAQNPLVTPTFDLSASVQLGGSISLFAGGPNPDGLLGQANIAVDSTSGAVYLLCSVDPPGPDPLDVHFVRSADGGATWSAPIRVNDDLPGTNAYQWFATMSVAPSGRIDVVWNDTRNTGVDQLSQLYCSHSLDGGLNWYTNRALGPIWDSHVGWPNQNKIGDYYDMTSDDEWAHLAFAATLNGEQDVYYLRLRP